MVLVSIAVEGDKVFQTYLNVAYCMDGAGFYSLPVLQTRTICLCVGSRLCHGTSPKTFENRAGYRPRKTLQPTRERRFLVLVSRLSPGAVLGVSRGAYMGGERAGITEVVENVEA
jgi:hypothetical protein